MWIVPDINNLTCCELGQVAIRFVESGKLIDPQLAFRTMDRLKETGVEVALATSQTSSQTSLFMSHCSVLSIAISAESIHTRRATICTEALERAEHLLIALSG